MIQVGGDMNWIKDWRGAAVVIAMGLGLFSSLAFAKPAAAVKHKSTGGGSFISVGAGFSYDGSATANLDIETGTDNVSGQFSVQNVNEYVATTTTCTAADNSPGLVFDLVEAYEVITNQKTGAQVWTFADSGSECVSATTGVATGQLSFAIAGGTGSFANATGSGTTNFSAQILSLPGAPGYGVFGAVQFTSSATITQ
jgi:hypothetical protein